MAPSPPAGQDRHERSGAERRHRRWRRLRARSRLWRLRMRSHPVLLWTWRIGVTIVGGFLLLAGAVMWFTPGPGWAAVILGLAVLASEFGWARSLLGRARRYLQQLREFSRRRQRSTAAAAETSDEQSSTGTSSGTQ
ncbi:PGPGW domain-containing protein [Lipingzhangella sp. LS1_29]|uniref:PGPGW domain-containing protein n=1 Tax=Lipingzhangella rawalii TaxID=2055835 RepID=A0ABU2H7P0_9ACTN|nr:PGPGW domain-containing protein [Lipingzhangella rawalii]MDS1271308.1 PGPGW domain-containing protein [Lipingzhangella rawalii]